LLVALHTLPVACPCWLSPARQPPPASPSLLSPARPRSLLARSDTLSPSPADLLCGCIPTLLAYSIGKDRHCDIGASRLLWHKGLGRSVQRSAPPYPC